MGTREVKENRKINKQIFHCLDITNYNTHAVRFHKHQTSFCWMDVLMNLPHTRHVWEKRRFVPILFEFFAKLAVTTMKERSEEFLRSSTPSSRARTLYISRSLQLDSDYGSMYYIYITTELLHNHYGEKVSRKILSTRSRQSSLNVRMYELEMKINVSGLFLLL